MEAAAAARSAWAALVALPVVFVMVWWVGVCFYFIFLIFNSPLLIYKKNEKNN